MKMTLPTLTGPTSNLSADNVLMPLLQPKVLSTQTSAAKMQTSLPEQQVLNTSVTALKFNKAIQTILQWAHKHESRAVCVANVHMLMEAHWCPKFAHHLRNADMVTPDGMPLVWMMKLLGRKEQNRVAGMDILQSLCQQASAENIKVFFVGSQPSILAQMRSRLEREYPNLDIVAMKPLPFRPLTNKEDEDLVEEINQSGAGLVFISLGCPKQERWMAEHQGQVQSTMIGLGGAFPVYAGLKSWAPLWVRQAGLEWLYRLVQEPTRLFSRYSKTIPPFLFLACIQLLSHYFVPQKLRNTFNLH